MVKARRKGEIFVTVGAQPWLYIRFTWGTLIKNVQLGQIPRSWLFLKTIDSKV